MTICAIHQPNFFPWAGYFDKIRQADVFIFLDEVAYPKSGSGSWCNRVKLLNAGKPMWFGLPINREPGPQLIKDVSFSNKEYNLKKLLKSLEYNYKKAPNYKKTIEFIEPLLTYPSNNLSEYNINAIKKISNYLGLKANFIRQSEIIYNKQLQSTELLVELTKKVYADTYLCGNGCEGYQQDKLFKISNIDLIYQNFKVDEYNTAEDPFCGQLSLIHYLMHYYAVGKLL